MAPRSAAKQAFSPLDRRMQRKLEHLFGVARVVEVVAADGRPRDARVGQVGEARAVHTLKLRHQFVERVGVDALEASGFDAGPRTPFEPATAGIAAVIGLALKMFVSG